MRLTHQSLPNRVGLVTTSAWRAIAITACLVALGTALLPWVTYDDVAASRSLFDPDFYEFDERGRLLRTDVPFDLSFFDDIIKWLGMVTVALGLVLLLIGRSAAFSWWALGFLSLGASSPPGVFLRATDPERFYSGVEVVGSEPATGVWIAMAAGLVAFGATLKLALEQRHQKRKPPPMAGADVPL